MLKRWTALLLCLIVAVGFSACGSNTAQANKPEESSTPEESKIKVSVTFNAMKEFVEAVGKEKVEISTIIPDGTEAHGFEPKAQDLAALSTAKIFVYNGLGMEEWAEEAIQAANNENLIVVNGSEGADVITRETDSEAHEEEEEHEEGEEHGHAHGKYDPHLWLSLKGAQTEASNIKDALIEADPDNRDYYEENYNNFISQLKSLYNEYKEKFQSVEKKNFVTGHAAFGYLCRDFGLVQNSVSDIYAEGEPSAQQLAELVEYCRKNGVTTIFAEEMASPEVSQTLANEVGAEVQSIYTLETNEDGKTYLERMSENLARVYDSLTR
ncbi:MAG: metal ABC transporter substrate-binding protein [Clostridiaceae bacterium]|jgi:zinc transport system substrate-binding protein|nr:metal ABC transporter substrate-binding protein [Clostridiaceae bacterium]